jgi:hypothetical protein
MTDLPSLLARAREISEAATPGPWDIYDVSTTIVKDSYALMLGDCLERMREIPYALSRHMC